MRIPPPSRLAAAAALATLYTMTSVAGPANSASTQVGGTAPSPAAAIDCAGASLFMQNADAQGSAYTTTGGVITAFSVMAGAANVSGNGALKLKVATPVDADTWTIKGSSPIEQLTSAQLNTFAVRVPVGAGDRLGLWIPTGASCYAVSGSPNDVMTYLSGSHPEPTDGTTYDTNATQPGTRLDVSATIEPDADGDGYGDDTQDLCPTRADKQNECVPPETTLTVRKKVRTAKRRATVTARFTSSEPGSTFACTVDGKAKACSGGSLKLKLKVGKHLVTVTATDAAGNPDPSPAVAKIKVKKKAHHSGR